MVSDEDDDIYFYGGMDMKAEESRQLSRKDISLESELAQGRFAVIYLANYYGKNDVQTVVAKTLKGNNMVSYVCFEILTWDHFKMLFNVT